ncbi:MULTISPECIES: sugar ABC transporter substrate-binding protein [unclassified Mesorhizobium]|uniref:sugar ABC transporter substrate-binding protein n=1 Tax=unclassified Mesorhizobium TaxID=325217 RepID=UPI000963FD18|nr:MULTISPECIES: sugar ABC transporter substrate-binding protein [unclassified Mesorhizobium]MBN9259012.1 sugar ABC transporter substrate-binding protein [Mesorhizobium sp.]OJX75139.1 MAG: hypothetical protein BGO93_21115 [Mesorhizobium sp. 65-26]
MKGIRKMLAAAVAVAALAGGSVARAEPYDDGVNQRAYTAMKGKKVAFVPLSMGFDLTQGWAAAMKVQADAMGYELIIRDPNWSTDAGAQQITQLISQKPDIIVVHNPDRNAYARLLKRVQGQGIKVLQVNLKSETTTEAFVGVDWYKIGEHQANSVVEACKGKSGKVAIMQGRVTDPANFITVQAVKDVFAKHPEIQVVSDQSSEWDATKAQGIAATALKQNPDMCGIVGLWDNMDVGTAAAIREAGLTGKVFLSSSGGGRKQADCDMVESGTFDEVVIYDVARQGRDLNAAIAFLLQQDGEAKVNPFALITPLKVVTKANLKPNSCWQMEQIPDLVQ